MYVIHAYIRICVICVYKHYYINIYKYKYNICMCISINIHIYIIYIGTYMHIMTVNENRGHKFERTI